MASKKDEMELLFNQFTQLWEELQADHYKFMSGNKAAGARARKSLGTMKKLVTPYRQLSIAIIVDEKE